MSERVGGTEATPDGYRIWDEIKITVNLGDYESVSLTTGTSRSVAGNLNAAKRAHRRLQREHEAMLSEKVEEVRQLWGKK